MRRRRQSHAVAGRPHRDGFAIYATKMAAERARYGAGVLGGGSSNPQSEKG